MRGRPPQGVASVVEPLPYPQSAQAAMIRRRPEAVRPNPRVAAARPADTRLRPREPRWLAALHAALAPLSVALGARARPSLASAAREHWLGYSGRQEAREPPVPAAEKLHRCRYEDQTHDGGVKRDRDGEPGSELPD